MMKKFFSIALLLISLSSYAQEDGVKFFEGTLEQALAKAKSAKKGPKMIFIDCYTSWCGPCKVVDKTIFPTKVCGDYINKNFIALKIDAEKGEGIAIAKKYKVSGFPTFLLLDENGNEINRAFGSTKTPELFVEKIVKALDGTPGKALNAYMSSKSAKDLFAYLNILDNTSKPEEIKAFVTGIYPSLPDSVKYSKTMFRYLSAGKILRDINNPVLSYLEKNRSIAAGYLGEKYITQNFAFIYKVFLAEYAAGVMALSNEKADSIYSKLISVNDNDYFNEKLRQMVQLRKEGEITKLVGSLTTENLYYLNNSDVSFLESAAYKIKVMTDEQKALMVKYYNDKEEFCKRNADEARKMAGVFSK